MFTLTPQARAIAAITLGFLLVTGSMDRVGSAVSSLFGGGMPSRTHIYVFLAVMIVVGVMILLLARTATAAGDGWARATAQAAALLAAVGIAIAVISLVGAILHNSTSPYYPYISG